MSNVQKKPGDAAITIDGETHILRLTLGALAEIEEKIGDGSFDALRSRLTNPRISDLLIILHALLFGGGTAMSLAAIKASDIDLEDASKAIALAFQSFGTTPKKQKAAPVKKKQASPSPTGSAGVSAS